MPQDISTIPTKELEDDLSDSVTDIAVCELALLHDIKFYSGGSTQERLDANKHFVEVITAELERRKGVQNA
jgi:hypothetical protein